MYKFRTVSKVLSGDLHTPVSLYLKLRDVYPMSALLECSDFHVNENSLSFIVLGPVAEVGVNSSEATMTFPDGKRTVRRLREGGEGYTVSDALSEFLRQFEVSGPEWKRCGLWGYTAFDAVRYLEGIPVREVHHREADAPDVLYVLYRFMLVFDHFNDRLTLVELCGDGEADRLRELETLIENRNFASYGFRMRGERRSPVTDEGYRAMVREGIRHCLRGDVFQVVLSRRFEQAFQGDDFRVYRSLRMINPSPYLFYFDFGGFRIFGSSPETHCRVADGRVSIDPIAGTAFRTGIAALDRQRVEALLCDPKENAEHVMLVDLARNDLSRNAHQVRVDFFKEVQYYSHVMHLVSRVSGVMDVGRDSVRAFMDTFPAGTLSGAPKVRAMQLITELEGHNRGAYGGCIGFIGLSGDLNQAITIRSFVSRGNVLYYQAGAGVVADSDDERELEEVNRKLDALNKALCDAEGFWC
jgi:anthranilate synthase component 1